MSYWNKFVNNQSIKWRYFTTLTANILKIIFSFLGGVIIARTLGPKEYGNYSFLIGSFVSITAFLNFGTSSAFYTFLSEKKRSLKFYKWYFLWIAIQFAVISLLIIFIFPDSWRNKIWLGHTRMIITIAFVATFMMNYVWHAIVQAGESVRASIIVQLYNIILFGAYLCVILVMASIHQISILNLFIAVTVVYLSFTISLGAKLKSSLIMEGEERLINVLQEFKNFCMPLVIFNIVCFIYSFADVWLLQRFGGAVQQGFYSIGLRFSSICLLATTSILNIFWKETVAANEKNDKEKLYALYTRISRGLCFISAAGACFLIPFSKELLSVFLGPKYEPAWPCLSIMFLYPVYQSLGQVNGSYFYALKKTGLYTKINTTMLIIGIPITYFLLAPSSNLLPGLSLGSVGMALKMVTLQIIGINLLIYFISKSSGWKFDIAYQFKNIAVLLSISFIIKVILKNILYNFNIFFKPTVLLAVSLPFYLLAAGIFLYSYPMLGGLERKQLVYAFNFLNSLFKKN